tara:strand:- start:311 stop:694 length:384 start_codon:yes stop_codon:yes gene_type:complete
MINVYFDGKCGSCSREIRVYRDLAPSKTFVWNDIANDPTLLDSSGIDLENALRRLHVRDKHGKLYVGVAAFILIWQQLPRLKWQIYAFVLKLPLMLQIASYSYNKLADYRFSKLSHCQIVSNVVNEN